MEHDFWHQKWQSNKIGFHLSDVNPLLLKHFDALALKKNQRIFLPLCGKTKDIGWLLNQGYQVTGCELSQVAVEQLFEELNVTPEISQQDEFLIFQTDGLKILVGDFFKLSAELVGVVDAVYDRASMVALPKVTRNQYSQHLSALSNNAKQLVVCYQYDPELMQGPPFSVSDDELKQHYQAHYEFKLLEKSIVTDGLKPHCPAQEAVWLLT